MREEVRWWLNTARQEVEVAEKLLDGRSYNFCAFHCQQAAEKALKALLIERGGWARTPSCLVLIGELGERGENLSSFATDARRLDIHYIDSRYPNGLVGEPSAFYDETIAREVLEAARRILGHVESRLSGNP